MKKLHYNKDTIHKLLYPYIYAHTFKTFFKNPGTN